MNQDAREGCTGCEVLPRSLTGPLTLYMAPPVDHVLGVIRRVSADLGLDCTEAAAGTLAVSVDVRETLASLTDALSMALTNVELEGTRALTVAQGTVPGIVDLVSTRPLSKIVAESSDAWFMELLAANGLETHFQPIVFSADPNRVFGHECLTRGRRRDGTLVRPQTLFEVATGAALLYHLDRACRTGAIRAAATHDLRGVIFVNFRPSAVYNPVFCLRSTVRAAAESGIAPERIVFEVVESEDVGDIDHLLAVLDVYRAAGFRVALDDLGSGYASLNLLHQLRPDFVKLDMGLIRDVDRDPVKATIAAKLLETAAALRVPTIAEGVETTAEWAWLRDHGAQYQQGYLFARPATPPPAVQTV